MYKKGSAWKRTHWDKWTFGRKVQHCLAVIGSLILVTVMILGWAYLVFVVFGLQGYLMYVRDEILLNFAHLLFD